MGTAASHCVGWGFCLGGQVRLMRRHVSLLSRMSSQVLPPADDWFRGGDEATGVFLRWGVAFSNVWSSSGEERYLFSKQRVPQPFAPDHNVRCSSTKTTLFSFASCSFAWFLAPASAARPPPLPQLKQYMHGGKCPPPRLGQQRPVTALMRNRCWSTIYSTAKPTLVFTAHSAAQLSAALQCAASVYWNK